MRGHFTPGKWGEQALSWFYFVSGGEKWANFFAGLASGRRNHLARVGGNVLKVKAHGKNTFSEDSG
jgi:hypothetical protein